MRWLIAIFMVCCVANFSRAADVVIPLTVDSGKISDRDTRSFAVPVVINGEKANFTWGCGGWTIVCEALAKKHELKIKPDESLKDFIAGDGQPVFLGAAVATIELGGVKNEVDVAVMRDGVQPGMTGVLGFELAKHFQWQLDPTVPSLTLRKPKTKIVEKPLLTLPLKIHDQNLWLDVKIRNVPVEVLLLPQSTDIQIAPDLQEKWDMTTAGEDKAEPQTYIGNVRTMELRGVDGVWLSKNLFEKNILVILMEKNPNAQSGLGQSFLNRFVYCVDPERKEFLILKRVSLQQMQATTRKTNDQ